MYQDLVVKCIHMYLVYYIFISHILLVACLTTTGTQITEFNIAACRGDTLTFNCIVNGGVTTVWKGSAFNCMHSNNDITLLHSRSNSSVNANGRCDGGELKAYAELELLNSNRDKYFSQINITTTYRFTRSIFIVSCFHDNGTTETVVSNWTVSIRNGVDSSFCDGPANSTSLDPEQNIAGSIIFTFVGIGIIIVLIIVMILIGMILGLVHKRKRKLRIHVQSPLDSSNIYSHTNNYIQQRSTFAEHSQVRTASELYSQLDRSVSITNSEYHRPECLMQQSVVEVGNSNNTNYFQLQKLTSHQNDESLDLDSLLLEIHERIDVSLWHQFGLELGVPADFLEGLRGYPDHECMIEIADYWLRNNPDIPTWDKVEDSIRKIEVASVDFSCNSFSEISDT